MTFSKEVINHEPTKRYWAMACDFCGRELPTVYASNDDGSSRCLQPEDALILRLEGGYGQSIDPCGHGTEEDLTMLICDPCIAKVPALQRRVDHVNAGHGPPPEPPRPHFRDRRRWRKALHVRRNR